MLVLCLSLDLHIKKKIRGPPKAKRKKASSCSTENSIVLPTPASGMVFPHNEAVANATHKKRKSASTKKGATKRKGPATTTSTSTADTRSTRCGLNLFSLFNTFSFTITSLIHIFLLYTQDLELTPMTLFLSKLRTLRLFFKTLDALNPYNIQCRHQGRNVPSESLHQRGLQLRQPTRPASFKY